MAIIHYGKNTLQEKLDDLYEKRFEEDRALFFRQIEYDKERYETARDAYRRSLPVKLFFLILIIAVIILLAVRPEIIRTLQEAAHNLFSGLENSLAEALRNDMANTGSESVDIGQALLNILIGFLSLIASILLWFFRVSSGVHVVVICFGILLFIAYCIITSLAPVRKPVLDRTFNEEAAREQGRTDPPSDEMKILISGLEGEQTALDMLSELGDNCHIYTNLMITYDGRDSETDIIVVAPHTVTIVEVKNYKDSLIGDWSDEELVLEAERGHTTHRNEVYNPVKQVATHAYRLSNALREHGIPVQVNRCVLFVNHSVSLYEMTDEKNALQQCPVFEKYQSYSLHEYLQTPQKGTNGSSVVKHLNKLIDEQV